MVSEDVISDCRSESEESEASMTVDYELEFEGSSELVYTDHDKWSLSRRTFGRHRMVCCLRKRKKEGGQEKNNRSIRRRI